MKHHVFAVIALLLPQAAFADVLAVEPVTDDVWALVGPKVQRHFRGGGHARWCGPD